MEATNISERMDVYINDILKGELRQLELHINKYNEQIMEFVQLKNTVQTMRDNLADGFKTQVNIGSNMFLEARVTEPDKMLVDVGCSYYLELSLDEAAKFCDLRIRVLTKECDVLREESIKKRTEIKLALMVINEHEKVADPVDRE